MKFQYIAVDLNRQSILLVADSMAQLNRLILSVKGQQIINKQAVWIYRIEKQTLIKVQQQMTRIDEPFRELVRPEK